MHSPSQPVCLNCRNPYASNNLPYRLVNCRHMICKRCVVSETGCPGCGAEIGLDDHHLGDYTVVALA